MKAFGVFRWYRRWLVSQVFLKRLQPPAHLFGFPSYWWSLLFCCRFQLCGGGPDFHHYVDDFHHYFRGVQLKNVPLGLLLSRCAASAACPYSGSMFEKSSEAEKHIFGLCKKCICSFSHTIFICVHRISIQGSSSTGSIKSQFFFHKQRVQIAETIPPKRKLIQFNSLGKRSLLLNQCIYQLW